jgi:hypothetical protein
MNGVIHTKLSELEYTPWEYSALACEGPNITSSKNGMFNGRLPDAENLH